MKKLLLILVLLYSIISIGQSSSSTKEKLGEFGPVELTFVKGTDEHGDYKMMLMSFQNKEYDYIVDIGSEVINCNRSFVDFPYSCNRLGTF